MLDVELYIYQRRKALLAELADESGWIVATVPMHMGGPRHPRCKKYLSRIRRVEEMYELLCEVAEKNDRAKTLLEEIDRDAETKIEPCST